MSKSSRPAARATAVDELYRSVISSQRHAHERLQMMQDIERRHRHTPLVALVDLAVSGGLHPPALGRHGVEQP